MTLSIRSARVKTTSRMLNPILFGASPMPINIAHSDSSAWPAERPQMFATTCVCFASVVVSPPALFLGSSKKPISMRMSARR